MPTGWVIASAAYKAACDEVLYHYLINKCMAEREAEARYLNSNGYVDVTAMEKAKAAQGLRLQMLAEKEAVLATHPEAQHPEQVAVYAVLQHKESEDLQCERALQERYLPVMKELSAQLTELIVHIQQNQALEVNKLLNILKKIPPKLLLPEQTQAWDVCISQLNQIPTSYPNPIVPEQLPIINQYMATAIADFLAVLSHVRADSALRDFVAVLKQTHHQLQAQVDKMVMATIPVDVGAIVEAMRNNPTEVLAVAALPNSENNSVSTSQPAADTASLAPKVEPTPASKSEPVTRSQPTSPAQHHYPSPIQPQKSSDCAATHPTNGAVITGQFRDSMNAITNGALGELVDISVNVQEKLNRAAKFFKQYYATKQYLQDSCPYTQEITLAIMAQLKIVQEAGGKKVSRSGLESLVTSYRNLQEELAKKPQLVGVAFPEEVEEFIISIEDILLKLNSEPTAPRPR